jgi:predicted SPOUT superfamily RNA methylase MTH1
VAFLGKKLSIAIPDTVLEERDSLREKTVKVGGICRSCAIYGVDVIQVFKDEKKRGEPTLIKKVMEYLETPQYLRRRLFSLDESLRYAGLLPPLRIPSHKPKTAMEKLAQGDVREGVTNPDGTVDIGLDRNPRMRERIGSNRRVTVRLTSVAPLTAELVGREQVHEYWGYTVEGASVHDVFSDPRFALKIATSRYGNSLQSQIFRLRESILKAPSLKLVFGSPSRGLYDIVGQELSQRADFVINLFAQQHVETVRTEEAVAAALNLVNTLAI